MYRFESEQAARRMSERPEQEQWWTEAKQHFEAEPLVQFSSEVTLDLQGDPDRAGFVQFRQGRVSDPDRAKELMARHSDELATARPDVLASIRGSVAGVAAGPGVEVPSVVGESGVSRS